MKKKLVYFIVTFVFFISITNATAQEPYQNESSILKFNGDSKVQIDTINVQSNTKSIDLSIISSANKGDIMIEIFDPNGNKYGNFSVSAQLNAQNILEKAKGRFSKTIKMPVIGKWKIKITSKEAFGDTRINYQLF